MMLILLRRFWPFLAIAVIVALTALVIRCTDRAQDNAVTSATSAGRAEQRADDLTETAVRTERANNAVETIRRDPAARNAECLRHSRTPENCD